MLKIIGFIIAQILILSIGVLIAKIAGTLKGKSEGKRKYSQEANEGNE